MSTTTCDEQLVSFGERPGVGQSLAAHRASHPLAVALTAAVDQVVGLVDDHAGPPVGWAGLELLQSVCVQLGRLQVAAARLSTSMDDEGLWATEGARSFGHWLAAAAGTSYVKARDLVAEGRALRDYLPATAAAGLAGHVSAEQVATLAKLAPTSDVRRQVLAGPAEECGEEFLLAHARQLPADSFRRLVRRWAAAADTEADERGYREACDREFLALSPTLGGFHLAGFLTTEHGATVNAALEAVMTPPTGDDPRTTQQRRAQGLVDLSRLVLDHGLVGTGAAVRPHLSVVVDFDTLRRTLEGPTTRVPAGTRRGAAHAGHIATVDGGPVAGGRPVAGPGGDRIVGGEESADEGPVDAAGAAFLRSADEAAGCLFRLAPVADVERFAVAEILGAGPISASVLARLACDSEIGRVVFGPDSQVINAGRAERTFAGPRRKAVIARDGTCRYPGCTAPPALGEIHHLEWWARDHGDTDINTGILLCWHHHDLIHKLHIEIRRTPTGGWQFLTRHGTPVTNTG